MRLRPLAAQYTLDDVSMFPSSILFLLAIEVRPWLRTGDSEECRARYLSARPSLIFLFLSFFFSTIHNFERLEHFSQRLAPTLRYCDRNPRKLSAISQEINTLLSPNIKRRHHGTADGKASESPRRQGQGLHLTPPRSSSRTRR